MKIRNYLAACMIPIMVLAITACGSSGTNRNAGENSSSVQENSSVQEATEESAEEVQNQTEQTEESDEDDTETTASVQDTEVSSDRDTLVVYFSRTGEQYGVGVIDKGNTAIVADMIVDVTGADSFEILPEEDYYPYTYDELTEVAQEEQRDNARPAYQGEVPDLTQYDTIFVGAPVWWGDWPMIMYTFFENNAETLAGKTLIPFNTNGGSGLADFDTKLADACPDSVIGQGLAIRGTDAQNDQDSVQNEVENWLSGIGY